MAVRGAMLGDTALPDVVVSFVSAYLRSLDDLRLLMAMSDAQDRWFDAARVSRELAIGESTARSALEHLARHNLLEIRVTGDVRYQFRPGTPELVAAAHACIEAYHNNPLALWRRAFDALDRSSVRDFSDAFRIWRDDDR